MENNCLSANISDYLLQNFGNDFLQKYIKYVDTERNLYIRLSTLYQPAEITLKNLKDYNIELLRMEGLNNIYKVLSDKENLGKTIDYTLGHYYIQSLSSMIPPIILNPKSDDIVLDLCAAPGSKTTQLIELMNNEGTLYANEPNMSRIKGLIFNLDKMNSVNFAVIKQKGEILSKFYENYFDKILCDVPCSGLGIIEKKDEINNWWNINQAESLAELQYRILVSAIKMLKVGGEILYSTCTLSFEENELLLDKMIKKYPIRLTDITLPVKSHQAYNKIGNLELDESLSKAHRIIPWDINSEGFFVAKLVKYDDTNAPIKADYKKKNFDLIQSSDKRIKIYLEQVSSHFGVPIKVLNNFQYYIKDNDIYFLSKNFTANDFSIFMRIGRRFGLIDKRNECHLHTHSVQILSKYITKNIVSITDLKELNIYLDGGIVKRQFEPFGQKIIQYNKTKIGTAIAFKDGLKSQFPRAMRTSEIVTPENE